MDHLLRHSLGRLCFVFVGRVDPVLPLYRYRLTDSILEIRAPDLAFSRRRGRAVAEVDRRRARPRCRPRPQRAAQRLGRRSPVRRPGAGGEGRRRASTWRRWSSRPRHQRVPGRRGARRAAARGATLPAGHLRDRRVLRGPRRAGRGSECRPHDERPRGPQGVRGSPCRVTPAGSSTTPSSGASCWPSSPTSRPSGWWRYDGSPRGGTGTTSGTPSRWRCSRRSARGRSWPRSSWTTAWSDACCSRTQGGPLGDVARRLPAAVDLPAASVVRAAAALRQGEAGKERCARELASMRRAHGPGELDPCAGGGGRRDRRTQGLPDR